MIPDKYIELIEKLSSKTAQKMIVWQKTSSGGEFKLQLAVGTLTVNKYDGDFNNKPSIIVNIYNDKGDRVDVIDIEDSMKEFGLADDFYASVRRSYYKVDETIKGFFDELDTDKIIGFGEKEEEDDLPF